MSKHNIILTGGPCAGKTTLLEGLRPRFPDAAFISEPATTLLQETGDFSLLQDPLRFCSECLSWSLKAEMRAREKADSVIQDRSIIDTLAYVRRDNCPELIESLEGHIKAARYTLALLCEPLPVYLNTDIRQEDALAAARTHNMIKQAYVDCSIPMQELPNLPQTDRLEFVSDVVQRHLAE